MGDIMLTLKDFENLLINNPEKLEKIVIEVFKKKRRPLRPNRYNRNNNWRKKY